MVRGCLVPAAWAPRPASSVGYRPHVPGGGWRRWLAHPVPTPHSQQSLLQSPLTPALCPQGFRLLLASPRACYRLFQEQQKQGHGEAVLFEGVKSKCALPCPSAWGSCGLLLPGLVSTYWAPGTVPDAGDAVPTGQRSSQKGNKTTTTGAMGGFLEEAEAMRDEQELVRLMGQ
jgi:hypothetical protein